MASISCPPRSLRESRFAHLRDKLRLFMGAKVAIIKSETFLAGGGVRRIDPIDRKDMNT